MLKIRQWSVTMGLKIANKYVSLPMIWRAILWPAYLVFAILFNVVEIVLYAIQTVMDVLCGYTTFKEAYILYVECWKYGYKNPDEFLDI